MCAQQKDENTRITTFRGSKGKHPKLEECLYAWFDASIQLLIVNCIPIIGYYGEGLTIGCTNEYFDDDFKSNLGLV